MKTLAWGLLFAAVGLLLSLLRTIGAAHGTDLDQGLLLTASLWGALAGFLFGFVVGIIRGIKPPLRK